MQLVSFEINNKKRYTLEHENKLLCFNTESILLLALKLSTNTQFCIDSIRFFACTNIKNKQVINRFSSTKEFLSDCKDLLLLYRILTSLQTINIKTIIDCGHRINIVTTDNCVSSYTKNELLNLCFSSYQ